MPANTIVVSKDKLSQVEWAKYIADIEAGVVAYNGKVIFAGNAYTAIPYQKFCIVFELESDPLVASALSRQLLRLQPRQHISWSVGENIWLQINPKGV